MKIFDMKDRNVWFVFKYGKYPYHVYEDGKVIRRYGFLYKEKRSTKQ